MLLAMKSLASSTATLARAYDVKGTGREEYEEPSSPAPSSHDLSVMEACDPVHTVIHYGSSGTSTGHSHHRATERHVPHLRTFLRENVSFSFCGIPMNGSHLRGDELARSHLLAYELLLRSNQSCMVVYEADAVLVEGFRERLRYAMRQSAGVDILQLEHCNCQPQLGAIQVGTPIEPSYCTAAYVVTRWAALVLRATSNKQISFAQFGPDNLIVKASGHNRHGVKKPSGHSLPILRRKLTTPPLAWQDRSRGREGYSRFCDLHLMGPPALGWSKFTNGMCSNQSDALQSYALARDRHQVQEADRDQLRRLCVLEEGASRVDRRGRQLGMGMLKHE